MHRVRRHTVLERGTIKLDRVSLSAEQSFVLMLFDGRRTVAEVASIQGMTLPELFPHVDHLLEVGAVTVVVDDVPRHAGHAGSTPSPLPPQDTTDAQTVPPPNGRRTGRPSRTTPPVRSARITSPRRTTPPPRSAHTPARPVTRDSAVDATASRRTPQRRTRSTGSFASSERGTPPIPPPRGRTTRPRKTVEPPPSARPDDVGDAGAIDELMFARIVAFEVKLTKSNHYDLLGIEPTADSATIERAFALLAAEFHPSRRLGAKLDGAGAALRRVFDGLTAAYDTLANASRRAAYDATLKPTSLHPSRRTTQRTKAYTGKPSPDVAPEASRAVSIPVSIPVSDAAPSVTVRPPTAPTFPTFPQGASRPPPTITVPPSTASLPPGSTLPPVSGTRLSTLRSSSASGARAAASDAPPRREDLALFRFYTSAKRDEVARRMTVFLDAADEALRRNDPIAAAENYRLALQIHDDPVVRTKLAAVESSSEEAQQRRARARARDGK